MSGDTLPARCFSCGIEIGPAPGPLPADCEWCCADCAPEFGSIVEPYPAGGANGQAEE